MGGLGDGEIMSLSVIKRVIEKVIGFAVCIYISHIQTQSRVGAEWELSRSRVGAGGIMNQGCLGKEFWLFGCLGEGLYFCDRVAGFLWHNTTCEGIGGIKCDVVFRECFKFPLVLVFSQ